jgi:uncharacterized protein (TIGR03067 family)
MRAVIPFILALAVGIPSVGCAQESKEDKELIQGSWKIESSKDEGKDDPSTKGFVLLFKDGKLTAKSGEEVKGEGTYTLDPSKNPKWIDIRIGDDTFLGIYELKGDILRICHGKPGGKRSTQFASEVDSPNKALAVLKREKQ